MSTSDKKATEATVHREYVLGVRILEVTGDGRPEYRFEAPDHVGVTFDDPDRAELYADVYFDTNGFVEAGTGERGVPPAVTQAGKDTLAAYLLTLPETDLHWVASFCGRKPPEVSRYVSWVRERAEEIRDGASERGMD